MITRIAIGKKTIDLGTIIANQVTIIHGRAGLDGGPEASSATLQLITVNGFMPPWSVGDKFQIWDNYLPRFTGSVASRVLVDHVETVERGWVGVITVQGVGVLARLARVWIGDAPWPQETVTERAVRILTAAGVPHVVPQPLTPQLLVMARDVDHQPALTLLTELATSTGAACVDLPDGSVLFAVPDTRAVPAALMRWMDVSDAWQWETLQPVWDWTWFINPGPDDTLRLPPGSVGWEPGWSASGDDIVNQVSVGWGEVDTSGEQALVTLTDQGSVNRFDLRAVRLPTQLATLASAVAHCSRVLVTRSQERWVIGNIDVHPERLDVTNLGRLARAVTGSPISLTGLPQPAPASDWTGYVEGWTWRQWRQADGTDRTMFTMNVSDAVSSLAVHRWEDYGADTAWTDYMPHQKWRDLTTRTPPI